MIDGTKAPRTARIVEERSSRLMDDNEVYFRHQVAKENKTKSVITTIVVMVILFIGIGVWYNNTHYNSTFQKNFMSSCENNGGSASSCDCAYSVLQQNYSYSEAKAIDADPNGPESQAWLSDVTSQCGTSQ
jgi:hypothetical protein